MNTGTKRGWCVALWATLWGAPGCGPTIDLSDEGSTTADMPTAGPATTGASGAATTATTGAATTFVTTEGPGDTTDGIREDVPPDMGRPPVECGFYERLPNDDRCVLPELPPGSDYLSVCVPLPRGVDRCDQCEPDCVLHDGEELIACDGCFTEVVAVHCGPYVDEWDRCCYYVEHEGLGCAE